MTMFVPECSLLGGPLFSRPVRAMRSAHRPRQAGPATQRSGSGNDSCDTSWFGRVAFPSNPRPAQPSIATDLIAFQV